jgi:iron-sulfur cluster repair protein YtfE (RIC family)
MSRDQINFRIEKDLKLILIQKDNYSEWVRDACYEKLERENDQTLINNKILEHENAIKQLKQLRSQVKKQLEGNGEKIRECLNTWYNVYRDSRKIIEDHFNIKWIQEKILPVLKKLGCTQYSARDILDMFMEHDQQGKVLINV